MTKATLPFRMDDFFGVRTPLLAARSVLAIDTGEYQAYLSGASGPSAARMLGRFCYGDPDLRAEVERHLAEEERLRPGAVFAEIAHLPHGRMGNVLLRPTLRRYEIPYLGRSGTPMARWIPVEDLFVGLHGSRVALWSRRLDREVVPRLSSALNYQTGVTDTYRFLASLQDQEVLGTFGFTWGALASEAWLPRVVHGKFVLAKEQWIWTPREMERLRNAARPGDRFREMQKLRRERGMPRHVLLADGDNELPVDLDNPLMAEALWSIIKPRQAAILLEDFPGDEHLVAKGPEGPFAHQLLLAFFADPAGPEPSPVSPDLSEGRAFHAPGSEWLYTKIYCGEHMADTLLAGPLASLVRAALARGDVDRWFFVRYGDPDFHLRLRFHGQPDRIWQAVMPALRASLEPLLADGAIGRIQLDTFEPEWARYGGSPNQTRAEEVFMADSYAALDILGLKDLGADLRWRLALASMEEYLDSARLPLERRASWAGEQYRAFLDEFGLQGHPAVHRMGQRFRAERRRIENLLSASGENEAPLARALDILRRRTRTITSRFQEMLQMEVAGTLRRPFEDMLASFIHMSLNRLLPSAHRPQELILYNLLFRWHDSTRARSMRAGARGLNPNSGGDPAL